MVSVLLAQNFTSHFFFVSLNSNCWQGNTYGTINYLLGVNLSGPHSESTYTWFVQAEKKCRGLVLTEGFKYSGEGIF